MTEVASPAVRRVLAGELCSGCGLCAALTGGRMTVVPPGYNRPEIPAPVSQDAERKIEAACPGIRVHPWSSSEAVHPYWGPYLDIVVGHAVDDQIRHQGSSGGVISALALHALETGLVHAVLEITADSAHPTRNRVQLARSRKEIIDSAGSRYAPSSPLEYIAELLPSNERILFIGKPCDVSALRLLGREDARVGKVFPLVLSFFCAGIPSLAGADSILSTMGVEPADLVGFRYRGFGWPGKAAAQLRDGRQAQMTYEESWGGHLSRQVQFRCKICPDAVGGVADLVCADAWYGGESGYPSFDELPGRSLIIPRTDIGIGLLEGAVKSGAVQLHRETVLVDDIDQMQPSQARRKRLVGTRLVATALTRRPRPDFQGVGVALAARRASMSEKIRDFIGALRRMLAQ